MNTYRPSDHSSDSTHSVGPLLQFFELVHLGDMIQSMVQVFFDKEMAHFIDKTDFLNAVMREKKRFENALDDSVAGGLNAGTQVLMNQVCWTSVTFNKITESNVHRSNISFGQKRVLGSITHKKVSRWNWVLLKHARKLSLVWRCIVTSSKGVRVKKY